MTVRRFLRILRLRWRSLAESSGLDGELDRELEFHVDQLCREHIEAGADPVQARLAARREMGNVASAKDGARDERRLAWVHALRDDLVVASRGARQRAAVTATAVLAIVIGISTMAAVLALVDINLIRPLPLPHADRLVAIRAQSAIDGHEHDQTSLLEFRSWKAQTASFEAVEASLGGDRDLSADAEGRPAVRVTTRNVSEGWFALLGVRPLMGRLFSADDFADGSSAAPVVISDNLWQRRFGGDPRILQRIIRANGRDARIVGVISAPLPYQSGQVEVWYPLQLGQARSGPVRLFRVIALRRAGTSLAAAQVDTERISASLVDQLPKDLDWRPRLVDLKAAELGWSATPLRAMALAAALLLLAISANVAGLLIARTATRTQELATRAALGAPVGRLAQQIGAEGIVLALFAIPPALGLAVVIPRALALLLTPPIDARLLQADGATPVATLLVVVLALGVGTLIGGLSALVGLIAAGVRVPQLAARARYTRQGIGWRSVLGVTQIAASVVLLVSAALIVQSYLGLSRRDLGFDQRRLLLFQVRGLGPDPVEPMRDLLHAFRNIDHAEPVAGVADWWLTTLVLQRVSIARSDDSGAAPVTAVTTLVTPDFFSAIRLPLVSGREFLDADTTETPWGVIINQAAAQALWPHETPLGRRIIAAGPDERPREVIGVVADTPLHRMDLEATPTIFTAYAQQPPLRPSLFGVGQAGRVTVVVRYRDSPLSVRSEILNRASLVAPDVPVVFAGEAEAVGPPLLKVRNQGAALGMFGLVTLVLSAVSAYGTAASSVAERERELAVRRALGAGTWRTLWLGGRRSLILVVVGLAVGIAATWLLADEITSELWGTPLAEPVTWGLVLTTVAVAVLATTLVPLRRLQRRSIAECLRVE